MTHVKGLTSAQAADAVPVAAAYQRRDRPPVPRYPEKPISLEDLVLAAGRKRFERSAGTRATAAR